jgi:type VI secretion system protein ImpE
MTPLQALTEGQLTEALRLQREAVAQLPTDAARLFLLELQLAAGQHRVAWHTLKCIASTHPDWPASRRWYRQLVRASYRRERRLTSPHFLLKPPLHAQARRRSIRAMEAADPQLAHRWADRADDESPHIVGHVDGREFEGLRDTDDRFASVLELFVNGRYCWLTWEQIRSLRFTAAEGWFEKLLLRPATIRLTDNSELVAVIPMIYPRTTDEECALGMGTNFLETPGPVCATGSKLLFAGEEELEFVTIQQLELREA